MRLIDGIHIELPIGMTQLGTFTAAKKVFQPEGAMHVQPPQGRGRAPPVLRTGRFGSLLAPFRCPRRRCHAADVRHQLQDSPADRRTIVMPESPTTASSSRQTFCCAAVSRPGPARRRAVDQAARYPPRVGLLGVEVVNPTDDELVETFAAEYARLRAHKGVTIDQAREKMKDLSYFGTMMVHLGMADGMVSGAINTTANTIRPSLEFIKTKPGSRSCPARS